VLAGKTLALAGGLVAGSGLLGVYLGGYGGLFSATGGGALALYWLACRARSRGRDLEALHAERLLAAQEEAELLRREEARLRAVTRSMAEEGEATERRRVAAETSDRSKTAFIKSLSQELRTPITTVQGMASMLCDGQLSGVQLDYARTIRGAAGAMLAIVDDVLALAHISSGALEVEAREFELSYCLESIFDTCQERVRGREGAPAIELRLDPALPAWVIGDRANLRRIVLVAMERALERSRGGRVVLAARLGEKDESGYLVELEVSDSSAPLDAFAREHMFDEYPSHEGGTEFLGFALARQIARLMGGDMGAEDRASKRSAASVANAASERGTVVWMRLRLAPSRRGSVSVPREDGAELAGLRVMLVNSSPAERAELCAAGAALGAAVDAVGTASEALELVCKGHAEGQAYAVAMIDAQISDIHGSDFGEVLMRLPEAQGMGLVLLRDAGASEKPAELARHGFGAWLSKPVAPARLRTALLHVTAEPVGEQGAGAADGHARQDSPESVQAEQKSAGVRVLLAEDNIVNQKVALLLLSQLGCTVEVVSNGMIAIEKAMEADFDLLLMDCQMPELDGFAAARAIRLLSNPVRRRVPIIGMSMSTEDRSSIAEAGMDDHITKPVRLESLARVVRHWAAGKSPNPKESDVYDSDRNALDPEVIASLRDLGGDDPSIFNELVALFLEDTPPRIRELEEALTSGSTQRLEAAAHALKSSAGNLGAYVLSMLFREIEACGRAKDLESAAPLVARSQREFRRVEEALREELA
jgi:CheY-like chemotaxis protein/HPt (histidine-containing phosphotransfer) domain-containing protein